MCIPDANVNAISGANQRDNTLQSASFLHEHFFLFRIITEVFWAKLAWVLEKDNAVCIASLSIRQERNISCEVFFSPHH